MFAPTSRYYSLGTMVFVDVTGRQIPYRRRRILPQAQKLSLLAQVTVIAGDRLDLVAARGIGDPEQFWQICDANDAMNPFDLVTGAGEILRIAVPQSPG
jgi:hypothetical protein